MNVVARSASAVGAAIALGIGAWLFYDNVRDQIDANEPVAVNEYRGILERLAVRQIVAGGFEPNVRRLPNGDVVTLDRLESGRIPLEPSDVEVAHLVEQVVAAVAPLAANRGQHLVTDVRPGTGMLVGDASQLERVLLAHLGLAPVWVPLVFVIPSALALVASVGLVVLHERVRDRI